MNITKNQDGNVMTFELEGWLDAQAAPELEAALDALPEDASELVFECQALEYVSSAGIRQFVAAHKKMGGKFKLRNVSAEIMDVLNMTGLTKRLTIERRH